MSDLLPSILQSVYLGDVWFFPDVLKFPSGPLRYYTQVCGMGMRSQCQPKYHHSILTLTLGLRVTTGNNTQLPNQTTPARLGWGLNLIRTLRGVPEIVFTRTSVLDRL